MIGNVLGAWSVPVHVGELGVVLFLVVVEVVEESIEVGAGGAVEFGLLLGGLVGF